MNSNPRLLNNIDETSLKNFNTNNKINSKISNGNDIEKETIQQVGLYGFNIEDDRFKRINATNQGVLEVENSLDNKRGFAQVLLTSAGGTAVKADTDCTVQEDPEHRVGWNLTNDVGGTKFNLYYFNGTQEVITLGAITSIYARAFINVNSENPSIPFFHIYTKPTGVGDAAPWYHSKIDYTYDFTNIIGIGEECIFYGINPPTNSFSNRHIEFKNKIVTGDGEDDEEILYMAFSSDSGASQDAVNVTANLLGFDDTSICRNLNLISESSLTGGATEAMQVLQLDQETVIASNTSSINNKISKGNDLTLTEAQQVLIYGEVTSGPQTGELHPIHITNGGDVEVEIADFVKSQATMLNSFPVVIASDQSTITVSETFLRATQNLDFTVPAGSNNTSSGINMSPAGNPTYRTLTIFGETDNLTDTEIYFQVSNDNSTWCSVAGDDTIQLQADPLDPTKQTFYKVINNPPQWIRLLKFNSTLSLETLTVKSSKIN